MMSSPRVSWITALLFAITAAPAAAHDQTDCTLEGEATCDEIAVDAADWLGCALFVADICSDHVDPAIAPGTPGRNVLTHKTGGLRDQLAAQRLDAKLALWKLLFTLRPPDLFPGDSTAP
jgi:hypothetical protein